MIQHEITKTKILLLVQIIRKMIELLTKFLFFIIIIIALFLLFILSTISFSNPLKLEHNLFKLYMFIELFFSNERVGLKYSMIVYVHTFKPFENRVLLLIIFLFWILTINIHATCSIFAIKNIDESQ